MRMRLTHDAVPINKDSHVPPLPPRRGTVSVVVPARARNFGLDHIVERLAGALHEVILLGEGTGGAMAQGLAAAKGDHIVVVDPGHAVDPAAVASFVDAL